MTAPAPPTPPVGEVSPSPSPSPTASPTFKPPPTPRPPPVPFTGFRSSLEHTGIPRSVLTWRPRLPSRNWTIFLTVISTISYLYYDDRRQCRIVKQRTIDRVKHLAQEPVKGSLDLPRKVLVVGARWADDDDEDRALRYFRKYVKPYLVAAAIDYEQLPAPLHGSVTRQIHASTLRRRRQSLGLETSSLPMVLPHLMDPKAVEQRELEGGVVLVGRASLKEYMEGLRRGWLMGVGEWDWEKEVEGKLVGDGVFEKPKEELEKSFPPDEENIQHDSAIPPILSNPAPPVSAFSFLSRPPPPPLPPQPIPSTPPSIPSHLHIPPHPLPPHPPILLLPFTNHLGFKQFPYMIYDFFTERYRVQSGSDAAISLILGPTRPFTNSTTITSDNNDNNNNNDLDFDRDSEQWYTKSFADLPNRINTARKDYYSALEPRLESARALDNGEREMTDAEKKSSRPVLTEIDLREERRKKELRWFGNEAGYEIVRKEKEVAWDDSFEGWLRVFTMPDEGDSSSGGDRGDA